MKNVYSLAIVLALSGILCNLSSDAQTTPVAQALPYSQNFSALGPAATLLPAGLQGWVIGAAASSSFRTTSPTANSALTGSSTAATITGGVHNYNQKIGILPATTTDPSICLAINTTGFSNVQVNFDAMTIRNPFDGVSNTAICGMDLQFMIGSISGTWVSVSGLANGVYTNNTTTQVTAVTTPQNSQAKSLTLPAGCNNQPAVYLRWVMRDVSGAVGAAGRPSMAIDNIVACATVVPTIVVSGPTGVCPGQTVLYGAIITNGGTTPTYQWKKNGTVTGSNINTLSITGLVTGDQISCTLTSNAPCATPAIVNSNVITLLPGSSLPSVTSSVVSNVSCVGVQNGSINISISGGTAPYTVNWDTSNTSGNLFIVTVGTKFSGLLPPGIGIDFYVDGTELKELSLVKGIPYTFNVSGGHPFSIASDIVGATAAFRLTSGLNPPSSVTTGNLIYTPNDYHPVQVFYPCEAHQYMGYKLDLVDGYTTEDLSNLKAGRYRAYIKDALGCTATTTIYTVSQNSATINATLNSSSNASCYGVADGKIDLNPSGGTAPYTTSGTGPTFTVIREIKNHSNPQFGVGNASGYTIDGIQGKELTLIRGIKYAFSVATPGHPFFISTSSVGGNSSSEVTTGVINSMVTTGTLFFTPDATHPNLLYYQCGFHGNMGWKINIIDQAPNGDLENCAAGNYSVKVTDVNGCSSSSFINLTISQPAPNTFYYDGDGDFYGLDAESAIGCNPPTGFVSTGGDCIDNNPAINPGAIEICNGIDDNCDNQVDEGCPVTLTVTMFIQGYYTGNGLMDNSGAGGNLYMIGTPGAAIDDVDTVYVSAMDASPPYSQIDQQSGILKTNGDVTVTFSPSVSQNTAYYIRVQHRNLITTWSKFPIPLGTFTNYDFTVSSSQAFDDGFSLPMKLIDTSPDRWAFYNGDVDQDGAVSSIDMTMEENDSNAAAFGYNSSDLNGNGASESLDMTIIENNSNSGVFSVHP